MKNYDEVKACVLINSIDEIYGEGVLSDLQDFIQDGIRDLIEEGISNQELAEEVYKDYVVEILPEPKVEKFTKEDFINYILLKIDNFIAGTM